MQKLIFLALLGMTTLFVNAQEFGLASYFSDSYHGKPTAYGVVYDKNKLTTAHKRHPLGTMLKVTREDNGKSVVVRVIDKGPFLPGRIVEISKAAAQKIGLINEGVTRVRVEVVRRADEPDAEPTVARETPPPPQPIQEPAAQAATPPPAARSEPTTAQKPPSPRTETKPAQPTPSPSRSALSRDDQDDSHYGIYKILAVKEDFSGFGVQVASMKDYINVLRKVADLGKQYFDNIHLSVERGSTGPLYKVLLGPFASQAQAENYAGNLRDKYEINSFVVDAATLDNGSGNGQYGIYKLSAAKKKLMGFGIQVAYLSDYTNVLRQVSQLDKRYFDNIHLSVGPGPNGAVYKVILGPIETREQAERYAANMEEKYRIKGFVVNLTDLSNP